MSQEQSKEFEKTGTTTAQVPVHLIRVVAVILVILLHASVESYTGLPLMAGQDAEYWWSTTIYDSLSVVCVPLFVMLSGYLLLQPQKIHEPIRVFMKKRFTRIGLAFGFWSVVYFAWSHYVHHQPLSFNYIVQGLLTGPYYHFWFLYLIAGLYLITPILRVIITYGERKILKYMIFIWFLGASVLPLFQLTTGFTVNVNLVLIAGWIGYFLLGAYLAGVHVRTPILIGLMALGYFFTIEGTWLMAFPLHYLDQYYFFLNSLTINVIMASVGLFMILNKFRFDWPGANHPNLSKLAHAISVNSLAIYMMQLIVLESLEKGFFGFTVSLRVMNPIFEIPLATVLTFFITFGSVLLMRKVPILRRLIG